MAKLSKERQKQREEVDRRVESGELHFLSFGDEENTSNMRDQKPEGYEMINLADIISQDVRGHKVVARVKNLESLLWSFPLFARPKLLAIYENAIIDAIKEFGWSLIREHLASNLLVARWRIIDPASKFALIYYDVGDEFGVEVLRFDCDPKLKTFTPIWLRIKRNVATAYKEIGLVETPKRGRPKSDDGHISELDRIELAVIADNWEYYKSLGHSNEMFQKNKGYSRSKVDKARAFRRQGNL